MLKSNCELSIFEVSDPAVRGWTIVDQINCLRYLVTPSIESSPFE
ncbi:MAG: hypothetical protein WAU68_07000 [Vitreimonas sp.]